MKKQKLFILIWNMNIGGIQTLLRDLLVHLNDKRPNIDVFLFVKNKDDSPLLREIKKKTRAKIIFQTRRSNIYLVKQALFLYWIVVNYLTIRPDICLTFLDHLSVILVMLKKFTPVRKSKIVISENVVTSRYVEINRKPVWFWKMCVSLAYPLADKIIVPSNACKKDLVKNFSVPKKTIQVVNNWTLLSSAPYKKKKYDLIYVGRFEKEKNVGALLDVLSSVRSRYLSVSLCLVGKGKDEQFLHQKIQDKGLLDDVVWAGFQSDVVPYLRQSKIFVTTTLNEGIPVAFLEAYSQGVPVVTTNFIGSEEIVLNGRTGFIVDSQEDMIFRIEELLKDDNLREKIGRNCQEYVLSRHGFKNITTFSSALLDFIS